MDTQLFLLIHGLAGRLPFVDILAVFFARYAIYFFAPLIVFSVWVGRKSFAGSILAVSIAFGVNQCIGALFFRTRPFITLQLTPLIDGVSGKSFPSDHTAVSFALATVCATVYPRWRVPAYGVAFLIAFARIVVGVHYPGDSIAGIVVGVISGRLAVDLLPRLLRFWKKKYG